MPLPVGLVRPQDVALVLSERSTRARTRGRPVLVAGLARATMGCLGVGTLATNGCHLKAPPGAEGCFLDAHAVSLFISQGAQLLWVMIFISISAPFIC